MRSVFVNGIEVGKVTEEQYSAMRRTAYRDSRIALVHILNVGYVIMLIVKMLLIIVPLSLFWVTVAIVIFSPESYTNLVHEFQKANPASITSAGQLTINHGTYLGQWHGGDGSSLRV